MVPYSVAKFYENVKAVAVVSDLPKVLALMNEAEVHYLTEVTVTLVVVVVVVVEVLVVLVVLVVAKSLVVEAVPLV